MRVVIEGKRLDTEKAVLHIEMAYFDGSNHITGDLYKSSKGTWYMVTPSQWSNGHHWTLTTPHEVIELYRDFFTDEDIEEISQHVEGWE